MGDFGWSWLGPDEEAEEEAEEDAPEGEREVDDDEGGAGERGIVHGVCLCGCG